LSTGATCAPSMPYNHVCSACSPTVLVTLREALTARRALQMTVGKEVIPAQMAARTETQDLFRKGQPALVEPLRMQVGGKVMPLEMAAAMAGLQAAVRETTEDTATVAVQEVVKGLETSTRKRLLRFLMSTQKRTLKLGSGNLKHALDLNT
jgi:hypothetical protein